MYHSTLAQKDLPIIPLSIQTITKEQRDKQKLSKKLTETILKDVINRKKGIESEIKVSNPCAISTIEQSQLTYKHTDFTTVSTFDEILQQELFENISTYFSNEQATDSVDIQSLATDYTYPLRQEILANKNDILQNIPNLCRPINLTFLTVIKSKENYYIVVGKRTESSYYKTGLNTLIPSGLCRKTLINDSNTLIEKYADLYAQDLFDNKEPSVVDPHVQGLLDILNCDSTTFKRTKMGINLITMHIELAGVCIIETDGYLETLTKHKSTGSMKNQKLSLVPVSELDNQLEFMVQSLPSSDLFCLSEGLSVLNSVLK